MLIKFDKLQKSKWFCLYDSKYIRQYRGECVNKSLIVPMRRYMEELYNPDKIKDIFLMYDNQYFMYADIMSMALFTSQLKLIKSANSR